MVKNWPEVMMPRRSKGLIDFIAIESVSRVEDVINTNDRQFQTSRNFQGL